MTARSIRIPLLAQGMEEGTITEWLVDDQSVVVTGQEIYSLETDKVEQLVTTPYGGVITLLGKVGEVQAVGTEVATIEVED